MGEQISMRAKSKSLQPCRCQVNGCGKVFSKRSNLKAHMRVHSGALPFPCEFPGCTKRFRWKSSVRPHIRVHLTSGRRSFASTIPSCISSSSMSSFFSYKSSAFNLVTPQTNGRPWRRQEDSVGKEARNKMYPQPPTRCHEMSKKSGSDRGASTPCIDLQVPDREGEVGVNLGVNERATWNEECDKIASSVAVMVMPAQDFSLDIGEKPASSSVLCGGDDGTQPMRGESSLHDDGIVPIRSEDELLGTDIALGDPLNDDGANGDRGNDGEDTVADWVFLFRNGLGYDYAL